MKSNLWILSGKEVVFFLVLLWNCWIWTGCIPENDAPEPGRIVQKSRPNGEIISYFNKDDMELGQIHVTKDEGRYLYRFRERESENRPFQDGNPIHCILVAIDKYLDEPLNFCRQDMKTLKRYFTDHFVEYNQEVQIEELYDEDATKANVERLLEKQMQKSPQFSTTVFAFSGHGTADGLTLYDQEIKTKELKTYFEGLSSRRVIWIMDSCNAGAFVEITQDDIKRFSKAKRPSRCLFPRQTRFSFVHCFMGTGKIILCSSKPAEDSKDGVFTRSLVCQLNALEDTISLPDLITKISEGIYFYNQHCHPENMLLMTPFCRTYGDIRVAVVHCPK